MLSYSNTTSAGLSQPVAQGTAFVNGTQVGRFLWCATAMDLDTAAGGLNRVSAEGVRTASSCYMRGLKENIRFQSSSAVPWFHRRICFTFKGPNMVLSVPPDSPTTNQGLPYIETTNGMQRLWLNQQINNMPLTIQTREEYIFKGNLGVDWNDLILAPLDNNAIDVKFDKTWTIKSGNAAGTLVERKLWHPMNKTLRYDDDENGATMDSAFVSAQNRAGMGDYYIYDIIQPGLGATTTDVLNVYSAAMLYWHEK